MLYKKIKNIKDVSKELEISIEDFTDFIAVASNAVKNKDKLFEARYHMFLRGIEGVFVTLKPLDKLFINKMDVYKENPYDDNEIGYKVFEISFCNNCNALFITGKDEDGYLVQKSKFTDDYSPEVYLLNGEFDDEDAQNEEDNVYQICAKCGQIKKAASVNGLQCGHGKEYINKLIKVKEAGKLLHKCPCCHSSNSQRTILRPYYLGTEAATSVIATALYGELPGIERHIVKEKVNDPFFGTSEIERDESKKISKQFLAFSDNRQTAAFFSTYLEDTYKANLVKRIMYEILQEKENEFIDGMSVEKFATNLTDKFKKYNIFPDLNKDDDILKEAWIYILLEMSNYKAKNSLLKNGFLMFDVDFEVPEVPKLNLSSEESTNLFKELSTNMLKDSAVDTEIPFLDVDIDRFTFNGFQKGYNKYSEKLSYIESWIPEPNRTNRRLKYLTKVLNGDIKNAREFLESIWNYMDKNKYIKQVEFKNNKKPYQLNIEKIKVKKIDRLYICNECKGISAYNIRNVCNNPNCNGKLQEYNYKERLKDDHYYNLFTKLDISSMIVKEHTAQLSSERAYEYQKKFKDKDINILSCSTTFEMGVDVGSLETVFMRNMPPSPANYAQRAGRAGRSLESAAYAITFCANSSHDLNYFRNPVEMIEGTITPPVLNISNEKIVLRHILASSLSFFWKNNPLFYTRNIGEFVDKDGFTKLKEYIDANPKELKEYLLKVVPKNLHDTFGIYNFAWKNKLFEVNGNDGVADIALNKYNNLITDLEKEKERRISEGKGSVDWITRSIYTVKSENIIEFLSKNNIIPKYGFPVDTVELQEPSIKNSHNENISLSRDLISAISDYAPESEIVADGKLYKSRYIKKIAGYEWPKYNYYECDICSTLTREHSVNPISECRQCGNKVKKHIEQYIIPKFGFVLDTEGPKAVRLNKPEKTYRGAISYIGDENNIEFKDYEICNQIIAMGNSKMDSLAILNKSPFRICETCGYGVIDDDNIKPITHKSPGGYQCKGNFTKYTLGHEFQTDVVFLKFKTIDLSDPNKAWTILYSLLEGLSRALNINRNELSGCLQWYRDDDSIYGNFGCILFDNTPGGAGYVRQLENKNTFIDMLKYGSWVVSNCSCGGENADTACYSCLCNYYNQRQHDILKRKYALDFYKNFDINNIEMKEIEKINLNDLETSNNKKAKLKFEGKGKYQESDSLKDIWNNLSNDCNEDEFSIIAKIAKESNNINIEHPIYNEKIINMDTNEEFWVREIWKNKQVMLFLTEDYEEYLIARKSGWKCYCTKEKFNIKEFIEQIEV